jgi:hypothetical protein
MRGAFAGAVLVPLGAGMLALAVDARAEEVAVVEIADQPRLDYVLDADGPPDTPGLSHRGVAFNFEYTVASAEPTDVVSFEPLEDSRAYAYAVRWLVDAPLDPRRWYIGISNDVAAASVPSGESPESGGSSLVLGNPSIWARGLWSSESGLAAGGGLGIVVPVPRSFSSLETEVVRVIRVVEPLAYANFQDLALTARPFFDIRHVTGPVTLQMRQGIDFSLLLRDRADNENRYDIAAHLDAYAGIKTIEELVVGIEISEVYQITADLTSPACPSPCDEGRVAFTVSPSLRLKLPPLSPSLSALFPLSTPLRREVASYWAVRLHLDVVF